MENFQMLLFPSLSTTAPFSSSTSCSSSSYMVNNSNSNVTANFREGTDSACGFLGLRTENDQISSSPPRTEAKGIDFLSQNNYQQGAFSVGSESEIKSRKNKGHEKKTRKARYAFQTRSQVDILDDGYRWRKYGQKAVKNNKFPRSYYRCTHQGCSVKKQVQRLTKDEEVVVTTYEGIHSHPIDKPTDNFERILSQMQITPPLNPPTILF